MKQFIFLLMVISVSGLEYSYADDACVDEEEECTAETCPGLVSYTAQGMQRELEAEKVSSRLAYEIGMAMLRQGHHREEAIEYIVYSLQTNKKLVPVFYREINSASLIEDQWYWSEINRTVTAALHVK